MTNQSSQPISSSSTTPAIVKLDTKNYLLWLAQFKPLLKGYDLEGYVDGTKPCPPRNSNDSTINPEFLQWQWQKQDQILLGWLLSSLTETVLSQVVGLNTSRDVWVALENQYASKSKARVMQLRRELQTMRKGAKSMQDYFLHAKRLADNLAASGHPVINSDLQQIILAGLDTAYDAIVTNLTTTTIDISMDDFFAHLLAFDMRLEAQNAMLQQHPVANVASQSRSMPSKTGYQEHKYRSNNGGYNRNRSQGGGRYQSRPQPVENASGPCQLCGRRNHVVANCWYRFDKAFYPHASTQKAYIAAPGSIIDSNWVPDSGATHHYTSDLNNLQLRSEYDGPDQIRVGNGQHLPIANIGLQNGEGSSTRRE